MKISVVIPAFNEEKNIAKVIKTIKDCKIANEIIVIDNNSTDNTSKISKEMKVKVFFCEKQGKGYAMEMGIKKATGDIIVFADGDICNYKKKFINDMIEPIINNRADFVKSTFKRSGGRVTELVAKPLIEATFPDLMKFEQPLSGIIAGKKTILSKIELNKDYGVDIGILIDLYCMNINMEQVNIGEIKNDSQNWHSLIKMAKEVSNAIIIRAKAKEVKHIEKQKRKNKRKIRRNKRKFKRAEKINKK